MAAILTHLGHKILKVYMVYKDIKKKVYQNTIFIFFKDSVMMMMMMVHPLKICTAISTKTKKSVPKYMLKQIRKKKKNSSSKTF